MCIYREAHSGLRRNKQEQDYIQILEQLEIYLLIKPQKVSVSRLRYYNLTLQLSRLSSDTVPL